MSTIGWRTSSMPSGLEDRVDVRHADIRELVVLDEEDEAIDAVGASEVGGPGEAGHPEAAGRAGEARHEGEVEPVDAHRRIVGNRARPGFDTMAR